MRSLGGTFDAKQVYRIIRLCSLSIANAVVELEALRRVGLVAGSISSGYKESAIESQGILLAALLFGVSGVLKLWVLRESSYLSADLGTMVSNKAFKSFLSQGYEELSLQDPARCMTALTTQVEPIVDGVFYPTVTMVTQGLLAGAILVSLAESSASLSISLLVACTLFYWVLMRVSRNRLKEVSKVLGTAKPEVVQSIAGALESFRDLKMLRLTDRYVARHRKAEEKKWGVMARFRFMAHSPKTILELIVYAGLGMAALLILQLGDTAGKYLPFVAVFGIGSQRLIPVVQALFSSWSTLVSNRSSLEAVSSLLELSKNQRTYRCVYSAKERYINSRVLISFPDKAFCCNKQEDNSHKGDGDPIMIDLSGLEIERGSLTVVKGGSGLGKSTLLDVLAGLKSLNGKARISSDSDLLGCNDFDSWARNVSYYSQSSSLGIGSLDAFFDGLDDREMRNAVLLLRRLGMHEVVSGVRDRNSLDILKATKIETLSAGQKQRFLLARAICKDCELYLLDEPSSALDIQAEAQLIEVLKESKLTIVIATHSSGMIKAASSVYEIRREEDGNRRAFYQV